MKDVNTCDKVYSYQSYTSKKPKSILFIQEAPGADFRELAIKESERYKLGKNQLCRRSLLLNTGKFFLLSIVT
jgi:hypothetical protein